MPSGLETMPADALAAWKAVLNLQHMLGITLNTLCGGAGGLPARTVLHDYELWLLPGSMDNKASRRGRDEQPSKVTLRECMMASTQSSHGSASSSVTPGCPTAPKTQPDLRHQV